MDTNDAIAHLTSLPSWVVGCLVFSGSALSGIVQRFNCEKRLSTLEAMHGMEPRKGPLQRFVESITRENGEA